MKQIILIAFLSMMGFSAFGQTAQEFYHQGAQQYIFGQKKEAIESVQQGLQLNPNDTDLKELYEILMKEEENQQNKDNQKENKDQQKEEEQKEQDKQDQQKDQQEQEQQEKQQPSQPMNISQEDMEKLLQALQMEEEKLQKDMQKRKVKVSKKKTAKDW
ncbi:MAG: hypothetical protein AAFY71_28435 [Bacteroidota bacterium]